MEMPEQARRYQERIDKAFPHGVIMTADDESNGRTESFGVPRPEVVGMRGLDPVVFVEIPTHHRNFSGVIVAWEPVQESPCVVVKVTMDMGGDGQSRDEVMRWSANLSAGMAASMHGDRISSLQASEEDRLYGDGEPE